MSQKFTVIAAAACALLTTPARAESSGTPHLEFVKLYIEQLGAIETIHTTRQRNFKQMTLRTELRIASIQ